MTTVIVPQIIADAYIEAKCTAANVIPADAIKYCDDIYQKMVDEKKLINEDFVKKSSKIDTVIYKNKYALPTDFEKMKQISIKYSVPTYDARATWVSYIIWDKVTSWWLAYICWTAHTAWWTFSWDLATKRVQIFEWYIPCSPRTVDFDFVNDFNNISESAPVYYYDNNDLYIYPRPKAIVKEWIFFDYIPVETTLTTSTDDATIKIEPKFYDVRVAWVWMLFAKHMRKLDLKEELKIDYMEWLRECNKRWRDRHYSPLAEELPSSLLRYMR